MCYGLITTAVKLTIKLTIKTLNLEIIAATTHSHANVAQHYANKGCKCCATFAQLRVVAAIIFTVRRSALHGLCDGNSVCPSATLVDCVHMVRPTIVISSPYGSPIILVSGISRSSQNSTGVTQSEGVE